jgi:hypothetical protein
VNILLLDDEDVRCVRFLSRHPTALMGGSDQWGGFTFGFRPGAAKKKTLLFHRHYRQ